jgi:hypothetical protein
LEKVHKLRNNPTFSQNLFLDSFPSCRLLVRGNWPPYDALRVDSYDEGRLSASGFAIHEESEEALVDALDGSEEFINPDGFASYFV